LLPSKRSLVTGVACRFISFWFNEVVHQNDKKKYICAIDMLKILGIEVDKYNSLRNIVNKNIIILVFIFRFLGVRIGKLI
jgi:hypothetical protein